MYLGAVVFVYSLFWPARDLTNSQLELLFGSGRVANSQTLALVANACQATTQSFSAHAMQPREPI
jgi:hypothetical protein